MATHSSVLAWRIPGTGEPGGLPSMGSHRVGHDRSDLAAAAVYLEGDPGPGAWCGHRDKIVNIDKQIRQVLMNEYVSGPFPRGYEAEGFRCIPISSHLFSPGLAAPRAKLAPSAVEPGRAGRRAVPSPRGTGSLGHISGW